MTSTRNIALVLLLSGSFAGNLKGQTLAPYAGEFLSIGAGGRSLAMGGAYTALASDASAGYWNPSAMTMLDGADIMLMHEERFAGLLNYDIAAAAIPYGENAGIGVTILRLGVDGIPDSRNALVDLNGNGELDPGERLDYSRITYTTAADWAVYASYAQRWSDELSYGISVKLIRRSVAEFGATGIGFDAGVLYRPVESLFLGAVFQDVTTTLLAWSTGRTELIAPTLRIGAAYELEIGSFVVTPSAECAVRAESRGSVAALSVGPLSLDPYGGIEVAYRGTLSLRGGMNEVGHATLGAGIRIKRLHVDYAYAGFAKTSDLDTSHRISLRLTLDSSL